MSDGALGLDEATRTRPVGIMTSTDPSVLRAERAIVDRRFDDAARHLRALSETSLKSRWWKTLLSSAERMARSRLREAEALAWQSLGLAAALGRLGEPSDDVTTRRMEIRALNQLGTILRRQERAQDALGLHRAAVRLSESFGSIEERWASLIECGLDAEMAGDSEDAIAWVRQAIAQAQAAHEEPLAKQAMGWDHLSRLLVRDEHHDDAVEAARTARDLWIRHDPTADAVARADLKLGGLLLGAEVARRASNEPCRIETLDEADELLKSAEESLAAFGPSHDADVRWAREQQDFARRLRKDGA